MSKQSRTESLENHAVNVSCVIPMHNEQETVTDFIAALTEQMNQIGQPFELIFVDDGSTDDSVAKLKALAMPNCQIMQLSRNFGKEIALTAGLDHAKGDITILIDCDFQHPVDLLPTFIDKWREGYDMVYGVQTNREHEGKLRRGMTRLFYRLMRMLTKVDIPANAGDFRLLDRKVVDAINHCEERWRFMKGIYAWVGFKSIGVPFKAPKRSGGESSWRFRNLTELALTGIFSFSDVPLRIWSLIGFFICAVTFTYATYIIIKTLIYGVDIPGYASILVAIIFFGGIQLLSIGILGEYIARIFNEVKQRPKYLIADHDSFQADDAGGKNA